MTEAEWLAGEEPEQMLALLRARLSDRKSRLLLCACSRRLFPLFRSEATVQALDLGEGLADGTAPFKRLEAARRAVFAHFEEEMGWREEDADLLLDSFEGTHFDERPGHFVAAVAAYAAARAVWERLESAHLCRTLSLLVDTLPASRKHPKRQQELAAQAALVRELSGNPFRVVHFDADSRTHHVASLARAAYDERILPSGHLDPARLGVLSDALEEVGASGDILAHLRSPGPHVRGCWALDLILTDCR